MAFCPIEAVGVDACPDRKQIALDVFARWRNHGYLTGTSHFEERESMLARCVALPLPSVLCHFHRYDRRPWRSDGRYLRNLEPRPTTLTFLARLAPSRVESRIIQLSPSPAPARAHTRPGRHLLHKGIEFKAGVDSVAFAGKRYAKLMQRELAFLLWDSADSLLQLRPCCPVIAPIGDCDHWICPRLVILGCRVSQRLR